METWHLYIHEKKHSSLQPPVVETCIPITTLLFQAAAQAAVDTSIVQYPRTHGHYNRDRINPSVINCKLYLLLRMNRDDTMQNECPFVPECLRRQQYHFSKVSPNLLHVF